MDVFLFISLVAQRNEPKKTAEKNLWFLSELFLWSPFSATRRLHWLYGSVLRYHLARARRTSDKSILVRRNRVQLFHWLSPWSLLKFIEAEIICISRCAPLRGNLSGKVRRSFSAYVPRLKSFRGGLGRLFQKAAPK